MDEIKRWVRRICKLAEVFWESVPKSWCSVGKGAVADGRFHDPNSYEMFSRVYSHNSYRRISKNYLVRREMVCRERRTRPLALPRRPEASAVSLPPICEFQLADNS